MVIVSLQYDEHLNVDPHADMFLLNTCHLASKLLATRESKGKHVYFLRQFFFILVTKTKTHQP